MSDVDTQDSLQAKRGLKDGRPKQQDRATGRAPKVAARKSAPPTEADLVKKGWTFPVGEAHCTKPGFLATASFMACLTKKGAPHAAHRDRPVSLNPALRERLDALCRDLVARKLVRGKAVYSQGIREPKVAHLWSTAYAIKHYFSPFDPKLKEYKKEPKARYVARQEELLKNVKALKDGIDLDGNVWWKKGWEMADAAAHAARILSDAHVGGAAAEGYPSWCPHHAPNILKGVSNHLAGNAIDATVPWVGWKDGLVGPGSRVDAVANRIIAKHGLKRPVDNEAWHYELLGEYDFDNVEVGFEFDFTSDDLLSIRDVLPLD